MNLIKFPPFSPFSRFLRFCDFWVPGGGGRGGPEWGPFWAPPRAPPLSVNTRKTKGFGGFGVSVLAPFGIIFRCVFYVFRYFYTLFQRFSTFFFDACQRFFIVFWCFFLRFYVQKWKNAQPAKFQTSKFLIWREQIFFCKMMKFSRELFLSKE